MFNVPHVASRMKIAMNVHSNNEIPQTAGTALHEAVNEPGYAKNGQETVPEPQDEENLKMHLETLAKLN